MNKRMIKIILIILGVIITLAFAVCVYIVSYRNPQDTALKKANVVEKQQMVGDVKYNYAEGPDNGPPLVLLHAQLLDWYTYSKVMPELSQRYHVFAVDYPGHGKTVVPDDFTMNAINIGTSLADFIDTVIGEPVCLSGNSSGGLLTAWIAANRPESVIAVALEDPPLFASEADVIATTVADKAFSSSYRAVHDGYSDYLSYWINNSPAFFQRYTGAGTQQIISFMVGLYRTFNPNAPIELPFMPATVQEMIRGMAYYDPAFGAAFHDGSWNAGFDHAEALSRIQCPVLLMHANFSFQEDGTLDGAISQEMADKAVSLIPNCTYKRVDSGHVINLEEPDEYCKLLEDFFGY